MEGIMEFTQKVIARSIGERIRQARKAQGYSQSDLAHRVGVSQPAIANWESGVHDPRRLTLAKLADALGAPLDWLAAGVRLRRVISMRPPLISAVPCVMCR